MLSLLSLLSSKNDNSELVKTQNFASQQIIHHKRTIKKTTKTTLENIGKSVETLRATSLQTKRHHS